MLTPLRNEALKYFEIMVQQIADVVLLYLRNANSILKEFKWDVFLFSKNFDKETH